MVQATATLKGAGFLVTVLTDNNSTAQPNTVVKQDPKAGTKAKLGSTVTIFVSPGGSIVPAVVGDNYQVALGKLSNAGFSNISEVPVVNPQVPNGTVVAQNPHAGKREPAGVLITLSVVKNPACLMPCFSHSFSVMVSNRFISAGSRPGRQR